MSIPGKIFHVEDDPQLTSLSADDCRTLQNHYANIMADTVLLVELAGERQKTIEDVYFQCKKANVILGNRIKSLEKLRHRVFVP